MSLYELGKSDIETIDSALTIYAAIIDTHSPEQDVNKAHAIRDLRDKFRWADEVKMEMPDV